MITFIEIVSVSLGCLIFLGLVGTFADFIERRAYDRRKREVLKQYEHQEPTPFWFGDPPDGDTFP